MDMKKIIIKTIKSLMCLIFTAPVWLLKAAMFPFFAMGIDIEVRYNDGVKIVFKNDCKVCDYQFPNGAIVRYHVDGRREVLQYARQGISC